MLTRPLAQCCRKRGERGSQRHLACQPAGSSPDLPDSILLQDAENLPNISKMTIAQVCTHWAVGRAGSAPCSWASELARVGLLCKPPRPASVT